MQKTLVLCEGEATLNVLVEALPSETIRNILYER